MPTHTRQTAALADTPTCPLAGLGAYLLGDLPPAQAGELEAHAEGCASCSAAIARGRALVAAIAAKELIGSIPATSRGATQGARPAGKTPRRKRGVRRPS